MNPGNPSGDNGPTPMVLGQPPQQQQQQQIQTPGGIAGETKPNCDFPPFSRVFVVCSRNHREDEIKAAFQPYGTVEDVWMVKDRITKENKGICYVKYDRASSAALAIETMDGMMIGEESKPIKVSRCDHVSSFFCQVELNIAHPVAVSVLYPSVLL